MIDIKGISKDYGGGRGVFDLNIILPDKGMIAVSGKSGSGKTTLFNLLLEIVKPTSGEIKVKGETLSFNDINSRGYFACIFQENNLFEYMTLRENLSLFSESENEIEDVLKSLGMAKYIDTVASKLSGGERKRACIAAAILGSNPVILADEPTAGLDDKNARNIMEILKNLAKERLVLLITHDAALRDEFCNRIITLDSGMVVSDVSNIDKSIFENGSKNTAVENGIEESGGKIGVSPEEIKGEDVSPENKELRKKENVVKRKFSFGFMSKAVKHRLRSSITRSLISLAAFVIIGVLFFFAVGFTAMDNADNLISSAEKGGISKIVERNAKGNALSPEICDELKDKYSVTYGYSGGGTFYADHVFIDNGLPVGKISMTEQAYSIFRSNEKTDGKNAIIDGKNYEISSIIKDENCFGGEKYKNSIYMNENDALGIMRSKDINASLRTVDRHYIGIELKRDGSLSGKDAVITGDIAEYIAEENDILLTLAKGKPLKTHITLRFSYDRHFVCDVNIVRADNVEGAVVYVSDERYEMFLKSCYGYSAFIENDNTKEIKELISKENLIIDVDGTYSFELYENMKESYLWIYLSVIAIVTIVYAGLIVGALRHSFVVNKRDFLLMKTLNADKKYIVGIGILSASFEIVGGYILSAVISAVIFAVLKAKFFSNYLIGLNFALGIVLFTVLTVLILFAAASIMYFSFSKKYDINDMRIGD